MKQSTTIRLFLLGLPLGLILLGVASLLYHFQNDSPETASSPIRRLAQQAISADLLETYLHDLSEKIGPRHLQAHPDNLTIASNYIESTVGPHNMGYRVRRQPLGAAKGESSADNLIITVTGGKLANESVVICAHYDSAPESLGANQNGTGVAALFSLAEAFVDQRPDRTLHLVFLANGAPPYSGTPETGAAAYVTRETEANAQIAAAICLDGLGWFTDEAVAFASPLDDYFPPDGNFVAVAGPPPSAGLIQVIAESLGENLPFPVQGALLDRHPEKVLGSSAAAAFMAADIPCVLLRSGGSFSPVGDPSLPDDLAGIELNKYTETVQALVSALHRVLNPRSH